MPPAGAASAAFDRMSSLPAGAAPQPAIPPATATAPLAAPDSARDRTAFGVLGKISASHMINDMMQSLIVAIYPILKGDFHLSFAQIGLITLTYQLTASLFQPMIGLYTDRRPVPYSLPIGMSSTLLGLLLLAFAPNYPLLLAAAALVGTGSAIFHPESSRVAPRCVDAAAEMAGSIISASRIAIPRARFTAVRPTSPFG